MRIMLPMRIVLNNPEFASLLYRVISYQNVFGIVIKSMQEILDSSKPHAYF